MSAATTHVSAVVAACALWVPVAFCAPRTADSLVDGLNECIVRCGYQTVPLTRTQAGAWLAPVVLDSVRATVLVDPRSPYTLLDSDVLRTLGFSPAPTKKTVSFGGEHEPLYRVRLSRFGLGTARVDSIAFDAALLGPVLRALGIEGQGPIAGIVGSDFLWRCGAVIDLGTSRMFITRIVAPLADSAVTAKKDSTKGKEPLLGDLERRLRAREHQEIK